MVQLMEIRLRQRKKFRLIKREFDPNLAPGTEKVVQKANQEQKQLQHQQLRTHWGKVGEAQPTEK